MKIPLPVATKLPTLLCWKESHNDVKRLTERSSVGLRRFFSLGKGDG